MIKTIIQYVCVLGAAGVLGNWFLSEARRLKAGGRPWYAIYTKPPGILLIAIILLLPFIAKAL